LSSNEAGERTRGSGLLPRVLVGAVGIPLLVFVALRGGLFLLGLVSLIILIGLWEFYQLMQAKGIRPYRFLGMGGGLFLAWQAYFRAGMGTGVLLAVILLVVMVAELFRREQIHSIFHVAATILGVLYVGWLASHFILLRELPVLIGKSYSDGGWYLLTVFIAAWVCDTGAYGIGRTWGRHRLFSRVSPKKSVEGAIGGVATALLAGLLLGGVFLKDLLALGHFVVIALIVGIIGQVGDLVESLLKRDAQVKDTSGFLPGHGGILDRFDGLLFAVPVTYWYLRYVVF
jgi:phosphatidate cytidylyltransferase